MKILQISKYPPIQGGVSSQSFWLSRVLAELGHTVTVLTNAMEVEEQSRVELETDDEVFAANKGGKDGLTVISTHSDREHFYIPHGNPSVTKLVGVGLEIIEALKPDVIYTRYLEPYGVAGAILSLYTGIGHAVAHAGSDVGRLMKSTQLTSAYRMVLDQACAVVTTQPDKLGVDAEKCLAPSSHYLPRRFFYPRVGAERRTFRFGIFGKVGRFKGTTELLDAVVLLTQARIEFEVHALWGGEGSEGLDEAIRDRGIAGRMAVRRFLPHWHVPEFICSCDAILFLENGFPIAGHTPWVPMEALACGRPVLTTREIADKPMYFPFGDKGCISVVEEPFSANSLHAAMERMIQNTRSLRGRVMNWVDTEANEESAICSISRQFDEIFRLCCCK